MSQYVFDFGSLSLGSGVPTGMTDRWATGTWAVVGDQETDAGHAIEADASSDGHRFLSLDDVGEVSDIDAIGKVRAASTNTDTARCGFAFRASGGPSSKEGYQTILRENDRVRLNRYINDSFTNLSSPLNLDGDTWDDKWVFFHFQAQGDTLRVNVWTGTIDDEPEGWQVEETDTNHSTGWIGLSHYNPEPFYWDWITIGTEGDLAPAAPSSISVPTNIRVDEITSEFIKIMWDVVEDASYYDVERDGEIIGHLIPNTSYIDDSISVNETYNYRIRSKTPVASSGTMQSSVTKDNVTWHFDDDYETGQFVNGDWWVVGPVNITMIDPDWTDAGHRHGWQVNPGPIHHDADGHQDMGNSQAFDDREHSSFGTMYLDTNLQPSFPYTANPDESIVKTISWNPSSEEHNRPYINEAQVLTVVDSVPSNSGQMLFRPPYSTPSNNKPMWDANNILTERLPSLSKTQGIIDTMPSLDPMKFQMDHIGGNAAQYFRPANHMSFYGAAVGTNVAEKIMRLLLDDSVEDKWPLLVSLLQYCIDNYYHTEQGYTWGRGGGEQPGHASATLAFGAAMFDHQGMSDASVIGKLYENYNLTYRDEADMVLWGDYPPNDSAYWDYVQNGSGRRTWADPEGYVDGGALGTQSGDYQFCCTSMTYVACGCAFELFPEMFNSYGRANILAEYAERWRNHGRWSQPDPFTEDRPDIWEKHGTKANEGDYSSSFAEAVWQEHFPSGKWWS